MSLSNVFIFLYGLMLQGQQCFNALVLFNAYSFLPITFLLYKELSEAKFLILNS